jgi:hypothetical protein
LVLLQLIEFHVQGAAGMTTQGECDVFVELSVLPPQCENSNADDRQDQPQPLHVMMQADRQLLIESKLSVRCLGARVRRSSASNTGGRRFFRAVLDLRC